MVDRESMDVSMFDKKVQLSSPSNHKSPSKDPRKKVSSQTSRRGQSESKAERDKKHQKTAQINSKVDEIKRRQSSVQSDRLMKERMAAVEEANVIIQNQPHTSKPKGLVNQEKSQDEESNVKKKKGGK